MLGRIAKFLLVTSAIAPIGLVYAWVAYSGGFYGWAAFLVGICIVLISTCRYVLGRAKTHLERFPFKPSSVEAADRENMAFMLLYLSPLFTAQLGDMGEFTASRLLWRYLRTSRASSRLSATARGNGKQSLAELPDC